MQRPAGTTSAQSAAEHWLAVADGQQLYAAQEANVLWPAKALVDNQQSTSTLQQHSSSSLLDALEMPAVVCLALGFSATSASCHTPAQPLLLLLLLLLLGFLLSFLAQDYYKAVMAEMYVDGAGMRGGGGGAGGFRQGGGGGGAAYGGGFGSQGGFSNGARGMDPAAGGGAGNGYDAGPSNVLRLRGLPFSAQKEDIVRWFEDCQITPLLPDK
jgi:uncharacterized membrane protein YgcG